MILRNFFLALCFCSPIAKADPSAIIEHWDKHMVWASPQQLTIKEILRVKVLNEEGYRHAVYTGYHDSFRKIGNLRLTVFGPDNRKVKKLSKRDALDVMFNPSYEIGDARLLILDPKYRNFPFTVEIEVEIVHNGFIGFPEWIPRYSHDLEVKNASMTLECPKDFEYRSREINGMSGAVKSTEDGITTSRWVVANLPSVNKFMSYKSFIAKQSKVHLTPLSFSLDKKPGNFREWGNFGDWFLDLNNGRDDLSAETKGFLSTLLDQHGEDKGAIAKAVYQFMQKRTRYISIQLGIGGFQTIPSDEVERTGYGDCKALTNYMKSMLSHLNIPSNYVLVNAGADAPDILHDFPSNQFNHVFLAVPTTNDTLWFECTSQINPPGYIGTFTDDRYVLWIEKGNSTVIRTPAYGEAETVRTRTCVVDLDKEGDALLKMNVVQTGAFYDEALYYHHLSKDKTEKFNYAKFAYNDFSIKSFSYKMPDAEDDRLDLTYEMQINGLGKSLGSKMLLPYNLLTSIDFELGIDLLNRHCEVRRSFTIEDDIQVNLPGNFRITAATEKLSEITDFGSLEISIRVDGDKGFHIHRKAVIFKGTYTEDWFDSFYEAVKKMKALEQQRIVLQSKT